MIRTRFAPSPTGFLHIGGVRTALFSYLYAQSQKAEFVLRMEDTDRERSKPEFEKEIMESMQWLGLQWDGAVERQSEKCNHYSELAQQLIDQDLAYEEVVDGKTAVRFRMPKRELVFFDAVRGEVKTDTSLFDDLVIIKSDGFPTYHFACAVDDHEMEISHVIRGEDHLSNTPRQILLFEAFGWKAPKYAHLPLIMGDDGTPLSKRHGSVMLPEYRDQGFLPEAILNYLALLGWGAEGNQEFFTLDNLIKKFSLKKITKAAAKFDVEKMKWMNGQHLKQMPDEEYIQKITDFFPEESQAISNEKWVYLVKLYRSRIKTFKDLLEQAEYCFGDVRGYDAQIRDEFMAEPSTQTLLEQWIEKAEAEGDFENEEQLETLTRAVCEAQGVKAGAIIHPLRFALTGYKVSPGVFEIMKLLGKSTCLTRVQNLLKGVSVTD